MIGFILGFLTCAALSVWKHDRIGDIIENWRDRYRE